MKNLLTILVVIFIVSCGNDSQILPKKIKLLKQKECSVYLENFTIYSFKNKIEEADSLSSFDFRCCSRNVVFNKWESIKELDNDERLTIINYLDECYQYEKVEEVKFLIEELRYANNKNYFFAGCYKEGIDKFYYHRLLLDTSSNKLYSFEYYD